MTVGEALLTGMLQVAVPQWIEQARDWPEMLRSERRKACATYLAEHGDDVLYKSKQDGASAKAFNHLAEGLALASFAPGGVTFMHQHWETT